MFFCFRFWFLFLLYLQIIYFFSVAGPLLNEQSDPDRRVARPVLVAQKLEKLRKGNLIWVLHRVKLELVSQPALCIAEICLLSANVGGSAFDRKNNSGRASRNHGHSY